MGNLEELRRYHERVVELDIRAYRRERQRRRQEIRELTGSQRKGESASETPAELVTTGSETSTLRYTHS